MLFNSFVYFLFLFVIEGIADGLDGVTGTGIPIIAGGRPGTLFDLLFMFFNSFYLGPS